MGMGGRVSRGKVRIRRDGVAEYPSVGVGL
jgi:hypothetical protein